VSSPISGSWPDIYYCLTVTVLFLWGALSDERTDLSFYMRLALPAQSFSGPSPLGLTTIFYRLRFETSFSSPPTTRRVTVEVFDPASTRVTLSILYQVKVTLRLTVSQSVSFGVEPHLGLMTIYLLLFDSCGLVFVGALSDERTGLSFTIAAGPSQRSHSRARGPWYSRQYFTLWDLRLPFSSPPTTRRVTVEVFDPASTRVNSASTLVLYRHIIPRHGPHGK
jgi:hypothetical protein